ncbi:unnamed protein product [Staurois parvus]|uniref:Uncharacterized protein n=1 Tax=Staurois parvus TaxID=386267 RepID=A0ABN9FE91_9NEOB|nr:unnamed protein product [Staurois parvus]
MGPPGNWGSWGPCVLAHTQNTPKKAYKRYQGHLMGPPTDPGPLGSARSFQMVSPPLHLCDPILHIAPHFADRCGGVANIHMRL